MAYPIWLTKIAKNYVFRKRFGILSNLWRPSTFIMKNIPFRLETNVTLNIIFLKSVQKKRAGVGIMNAFKNCSLKF